MKRMAKIAIALLISSTYIMPGLALAQPTSAEQLEKLPTLFVISTESAAVHQHGNTFTLSLNSPDVTYFSDRPYRKAGQLSISQFKNLWSTDENNFKQDHPNAFVAGLNTSVSAKDSQVIVLSNPKVAGDSMTFKIKQIGGHHSLEAGKLGRTTVFIDMYKLHFY